METLVTLVVLIVFALLSWLFHYVNNSYPLTKDEISILASLRRFSDVLKHYNFGEYAIEIDAENKKKIKPAGNFYNITSTIQTFPSFVAALLKGKKQEWLIAGIADNKDVKGFWANKGNDSSSVSSKIGYYEMLSYIKQNQADTILLFHNHTNAILSPSDIDINSANEDGKRYNESGINYFAFVVGRGNYKQYALWILDDLFPKIDYINKINKVNGTRRSINYDLNMELKRLKHFRNTHFPENISSNIFC